MNYFVIFIFLIIILVVLFKAFGDKMTHKYQVYHHSQIEKDNNDKYNNLKNTLNIKDENVEVEPSIQTLSEEDAFVRCHVPTLNTQQCWQSRFFECPVTNGSYAQCTNNYIRLPKRGNAPCETGRAGFEMAPPKMKLSENCYYQSTKLLSQQNKNMNKNMVLS
jgi:hypothetical protein